MTNPTKSLKQEITSHKWVYGILILLIIAAVFLRTYRIDQLLQFHFDQGRDALVIQNLLHGDILLLGPTTGIEGLFLGPFFYYFLAPGYLIGMGSPVIASFYQTFFIILGILVTFYLVREYFDRKIALISTFLMTFSYYHVLDDRWLSNPTPTAFFTPVTLLFFTKALKRPWPFLFLAALGIGILLQLEAAVGFFFLITSVVFILVNFRKWQIKDLLGAFTAFFLTIIPQIIFELKNNFLLTHTFLKFFTDNTYGDKASTFQIPSSTILENRLHTFAQVFFQKLEVNFPDNFAFIFIIFVVLCVVISFKWWKNNLIRVLAFFFLGPLIGFVFYHGNYGQIYTYYFIPMMPMFFIYLSIMLGQLFRGRWGIVAVILILGVFFWQQQGFLKNYLIAGVDESPTVALGNQSLAINYILKDSSGQPFNVDVYLPPVIPYPYEYLLSYYGDKTGIHQSPKREKLLYTLHEVDTERPNREITWLKRQAGLGRIYGSVQFGGITVEKRERLKDE